MDLKKKANEIRKTISKYVGLFTDFIRKTILSPPIDYDLYVKGPCIGMAWAILFYTIAHDKIDISTSIASAFIVFTVFFSIIVFRSRFIKYLPEITALTATGLISGGATYLYYSTPDFMIEIEKYQTLCASLIALCAALWAYSGTTKQSRQSADKDDRERYIKQYDLLYDLIVATNSSISNIDKQLNHTTSNWTKYDVAFAEDLTTNLFNEINNHIQILRKSFYFYHITEIFDPQIMFPAIYRYTEKTNPIHLHIWKKCGLHYFMLAL